MKRFSEERLKYLDEFSKKLEQYNNTPPSTHELSIIVPMIYEYCDKFHVQPLKQKMYDSIRLFMYEEIRKGARFRKIYPLNIKNRKIKFLNYFNKRK